jgi:hypothetical protein
MRRRYRLRSALLAGLVAALWASRGQAQPELPDARPVPRMQVIPLPDDRASFQRDGVEVTLYHFGAGLRRPFLFPVVGPSGRSLTRMGHPHDPVTHSHHNSVWVSHNDVNGESFWDDRGPGRIVHRRVIRYDDGAESASVVVLNDWVGKGDRVHLTERRGVTVRTLDDGQWLMVLDLQFDAEKEPATLGKTPFGMVGVRMAKTIGVKDGGGRIRNSEGNEGEQGPNGVFRKRARWVDYSGPITEVAAEGITLLDHPSNPGHPSPFHVRDDGWMGACLTADAPITIRPSTPLRLRYGLYVHGGVPRPEVIESIWAPFSKTTIEDLPMK